MSPTTPASSGRGRAIAGALLAGAASVLMAGCAELPAVEPGVCGNQVIEAAREDCDGLPDPAHGPGLTCERCRYLCDPAEPAPACPPGWGCGRDGTCRHGTGRFLVASGVPATFPSIALAAGDQDGDGADELFGSSAEGFSVLAAPARVLEQREFGGIGGSTMASADLDGDGLAELVRSNRRGVFGVTGVAGTSPRLMLATEVLDQEPNTPGLQPVDPHSQVVVISLDGALRFPVAAVLTAGLVRWLPLGQSQAAITFRNGMNELSLPNLLPPVVANVDLDPSRDGDELVVGALGEPFMYQLRFSPQRGFRPIPVEDGATLVGAPMVVNHGAGNLELLAPVDGGRVVRATPEPVVASPGLRAFTTLSLAPRFAAPAPPRCGMGAGTAEVGAMPLAAADVDGDGDIDYITPDGVVRVDAAPANCLVVAFPGSAAIAAAVLDADGDDSLDVAWITADDNAVWLAVQHDDGTFAPRRIGVGARPRRLLAATFDWDDHGDLLVETEGDAGSSALMMIKGTRTAGQDIVLSAPRVPGLTSLVLEPAGGVDGLLLLGNDGSGTYVSRVQVLESGDAYFSELAAPAASAQGLAAATVQRLLVADADGDDRADDLVALVGDGNPAQLRVWADQRWYLHDGAVRDQPAFPHRADVAAAVADLDGDGADELVMADGGMLSRYDLRDPTAAPASSAGPAADTITAVRRGGVTCVAMASATAGSVLRCDGTADLVLTAAPAFALAALDLDGDPDDEVVVATGGGLELIDLTGGGAASLGTLVLSTAPMAPVAAQAGDFDGDGVPDLALGSGAGLILLWGVGQDGGAP